MRQIRLDVPRRQWIGPNWCNEDFAMNSGFEFTDWPNLTSLSLHTAGPDNLLNLIRGMPVSRGYYVKRVPRRLFADAMQNSANQSLIEGYRYDYEESLDLAVLRETASNLHTRYRVSFSTLDLAKWMWRTGLTTGDPKGYAQLAYSINFENRYRFSLTPELHYPEVELLSVVLRTMHFREDNPKVVCWYDNPELLRVEEQPDFRDLKVRSARWPKFLQMLNRKFGFTFPEDEIQAFATWVGENLKIPKYTFRLVDGDLIPEYYQKEYFGSCMHESEATEFYSAQTNVRMLIIEDEYKNYIGRGLVWDGNYIDGSPVTLLDRVYPSDGGRHIKAAMQYAKEQGWEYKVEHSIGGALSVDRRIKVSVTDNGYYPYMDTFQFCSAPDYAGNFILSNNSGSGRYPYALDSTDNYCPWEEGTVCGSCGEFVSDDDVTYIDGEAYCSYCRDENFFYDEVDGDWVNNDDGVTIENCAQELTLSTNHSEVVYSDTENNYYWIGFSLYGFRFENVAEGTYGFAECDYIMDYHLVTMPDGTEHIVHENDEQALEELKAEGGTY